MTDNQDPATPALTATELRDKILALSTLGLNNYKQSVQEIVDVFDSLRSRLASSLSAQRVVQERENHLSRTAEAEKRRAEVAEGSLQQKDAEIAKLQENINKAIAALQDPPKELLDTILRATGMPEVFLDHEPARVNMTAALRSATEAIKSHD